MFARTLALLATIAGALVAQDGAQAPSEERSPWQFTGVLDGFYSADLNDPALGLAEFRNFDWKQGWQLNAAEVTVERDGPRFGFRVDAGYGEMFRIMNLADPWRGPNRYISQAFVSYKPLRKLRIDFGKFYTSAGGEVPESYNNFNYSRSLLFTLGEPYYHFGLRATVPVTKSFSAGVQLVNGWNDVRDNNSGKSVALVSNWTGSKWGWSQALIAGPEKPGTDIGFRRLYDSVVTLNPAARLSAYVEALWGMDPRIGGGKDQWSGVAEAARLAIHKKWSVSERVERFNDTTGFNTGTPQHLEEATATLEYRPAAVVSARLEARRDFSDRAVFDRGGVPRAAKDQTTLLAGLMVVFKGGR